MAKDLRIGLAVVLSLFAVTPSAQAQSPVSVTAEYDFFVGGFRVAEVALTATVDEAAYVARSNVVTRGVLDVVLRGRAASQVRGTRNGYGQLLPTGFATHYTSRTSDQKIRITYEGANPAHVMFEPQATDSDQHARPQDQLGSLDPLSASVMALMPSIEADLCNRSIPVFDGKRRFDIIFLPPDPARFDDSAPAPDWHKPLQRCLGVYERISGFGTESLEGQKYYPFDVWFEDSGNGVFRAVRLSGKTKLGFAIGNLRVAE